MTNSRPAVLQTLEADGHDIRLQYMTPDDAAALLAFARSLPGHDLLFLSTDITEVDGVNEWVEGVVAGRMGVILAMEGEQIVGFASVVRNAVSWMRHIAEVRVIVGERMRHHGLGRCLTEEAFRIADDMGVMRMLAQMTLDQQSAMHTFRHLGFVPLAILHDQVVDEDGQTYDLVLMHQDVAGFVETLRRLNAGE
ncbi:MAG: GNAT family N-acetyltransferase [Rhodothermales bacterium]